MSHERDNLLNDATHAAPAGRTAALGDDDAPWHGAAGDDGAESIARARAHVLRKPPAAKFAAIDVGTNSLHLVMAEISPEGDFQILGRDKEMVRLGQGGFAEHVLTDRAMDEGMAALARMQKMARLKGIDRVQAVATSAVREARNGGDFVERVRDALGLDLLIIPPEEEARLIYLAVRHAVDLGDGDNLIIDIGGGSVELIVGNARRAEMLASVKLGGSRLAELHVRNDPPTIGELKELRRRVERTLKPVFGRIGRRAFARCIATSGTAENLALMAAHRRGARDVEDAARLRVGRGELKTLMSALAGRTRDERAKIPGIDAKRADSILPGAIVLMTVLKAYGLDGFHFCDMALREGIIIDHITRQRARLLARANWPDPRMRSVVQLAERCGYRRQHAEQVVRLALSLFEQLQPLHELEARFGELLKYACLLHDVGYLISHRGHHKHSYYLIHNGGLQGFDAQEIELIANVARYHRKGRPRKSHYSYQHLDRPYRRVLRRLIPLLRLANALDRTHYSVVESVSAEILPDRVRVLVHSQQDVELELWTAQRQNELFEWAYGRPLTVLPSSPAASETPRAD